LDYPWVSECKGTKKKRNMQVFIPVFSVHYVFLTNAGIALSAGDLGGSGGDLL
jgi:hypothetical protein